MKEVIVLYPATSSHHLTSMVELGKLIFHHHTNFSIIILVPSFSLEPSLTSYTQYSNLPISFFPLPPTKQDSLRGDAVIFELIRLSIPVVLDALKTISLTSKILAFITSTMTAISYDTFKVPTYFYFTSCASALATILYLPTIHNQITTNSFKDNTIPLHIPGLPPIKPSHLSELLLDPNHPAYHEFLSFASLLPILKGIILNTFDLLEPQAIKAITDGACASHASAIPPLYCIGPLIVDAKDRGASDDSVLKCLRWLDSQPSRSVVFLCFGRKGAFSAPQLKEIASGLERSKQRFLWAVRNPPPNSDTEPDIEELLPQGFLERTKEKGLVVKSWAPQAAILSHQSVGGFVTHCGWNSVLEAVSNGVPMVGWPLYAEQHMNSVVLAEEMKLSTMPILAEEEAGKERVVRAEEVDRKVMELMGLEGKALRERILEMKEMSMGAWTNGGSSFTALSKLVASWKHEY